MKIPATLVQRLCCAEFQIAKLILHAAVVAVWMLLTIHMETMCDCSVLKFVYFWESNMISLFQGGGLVFALVFLRSHYNGSRMLPGQKNNGRSERS